jgi:hypothetical protein
MSANRSLKLTRLYDFVAGSPAVADSVDGEFNQVVLQHNNAVDDVADLQTQMTTHKTSTDHDGRYYTETELTATTGGGLIGNVAFDGSPTVLQATLEWLKDQIDATVLGDIPDGSITDVKLADNSITDVKIVDNSITDVKMASEMKKGITNGVASLDATGNVPVNQLGNIVNNFISFKRKLRMGVKY